MSITTILFDLDGTLLPMDQDTFVKAYFGRLAAWLAPHGYEPQRLIDGIWAGTAAMIQNDGTVTNEEMFWRTFSAVYGADVRRDEPLFEVFYREDFPKVAAVCGHNPEAARLIARVKAAGYTAVLATNPLFPAIATENRMAWAGLSPDDFALYTTYENTGFCKPNLDYYRDILDRIGAKPEECLMVGNDVADDMVTEKLGMQVFLLTDCLINKEGRDVSRYPHGGFSELNAFLFG